MKIRAEAACLEGETLLETQISSDLRWKTALSVRIAGLLVDRALVHPEEREKLEVCCEEALKNAIIHGNKENPRTLVTVRVFETPEAWGISVKDQGQGFAADRIPDPEDPNFVWMESGRGLHLMQHVMDSVELYSGGNHIVLLKQKSSVPSTESLPVRFGKGTLGLTSRGEALLVEVALPSTDESAVDDLFRTLQEETERRQPRALVLDLSTTAYMSSHAIGKLVALYKTCLRSKTQLRLTGLNADLRHVFEEMRLDKILCCFDTTEEALVLAR
jgi:anti-anti-sigma factor